MSSYTEKLAEVAEGIAGAYRPPKIDTPFITRQLANAHDTFKLNITSTLYDRGQFRDAGYQKGEDLKGAVYTTNTHRALQRKGLDMGAIGRDAIRRELTLEQVLYMAERRRNESVRRMKMQGGTGSFMDTAMTFASSFAGSMADPVNIPLMFLGPPGFSAAVARNTVFREIGKQLSSTVGKRLTYGAGANMGVNAALEHGIILPGQQELGTQYSKEDAAMSILLVGPLTYVLGGAGEFLTRTTRRNILIKAFDRAIDDQAAIRFDDILKYDRNYSRHVENEKSIREALISGSRADKDKAKAYLRDINAYVKGKKLDPVKRYDGGTSYSVRVANEQHKVTKSRLAPTYDTLSKLADEYESGKRGGKSGITLNSPHSSSLQKAIANVLGEVFGVKVRYIDPFYDDLIGERGVRIDGAAFREKSDTIFLIGDKLTSEDFMRVAGHELGHTISFRLPHVWRSIVETIEKSDHADPIFEGKLQKLIDKMGARQFGAESPLLKIDEAYAEIFGELTTLDSFWKALGLHSPQHAKTLSDYISQTMGRLFSRVRQQLRRMGPNREEHKALGAMAWEVGKKTRAAIAKAGIAPMLPGQPKRLHGTRLEFLRRHRKAFGYEKRARWYDPDNPEFQERFQKLMETSPRFMAYNNSNTEAYKDNLGWNFLNATFIFKEGTDSEFVPKLDGKGLHKTLTLGFVAHIRKNARNAWLKRKKQYDRLDTKAPTISDSVRNTGFYGILPPEFDYKRSVNLKNNYIAYFTYLNELEVPKGNAREKHSDIVAKATRLSKQHWEAHKADFLRRYEDNALQEFILDNLRRFSPFVEDSGSVAKGGILPVGGGITERLVPGTHKRTHYEGLKKIVSEDPLIRRETTILDITIPTPGDPKGGIRYNGFPQLWDVKNRKELPWDIDSARGLLDGTSVVRLWETKHPNSSTRIIETAINEGEPEIEKFMGLTEGQRASKLQQDIDEWKKTLLGEKEDVYNFFEDLYDYTYTVNFQKGSLGIKKKLSPMEKLQKERAYPTWDGFEEMYGNHIRYTPMEHIIDTYKGLGITIDVLLKKKPGIDELYNSLEGLLDTHITEGGLDRFLNWANTNVADRMSVLAEAGLEAGTHSRFDSKAKQMELTELFNKFLTDKYPDMSLREILGRLYFGRKNRKTQPGDYGIPIYDRLSEGVLSDDPVEVPKKGVIMADGAYYEEVISEGFTEATNFKGRDVLSLEEESVKRQLEELRYSVQPNRGDPHDTGLPSFSVNRAAQAKNYIPSVWERMENIRARGIAGVEETLSAKLNPKETRDTKAGDQHINQVKAETNELIRQDREILSRKLRQEFHTVINEDFAVNLNPVLDYILKGRESIKDLKKKMEARDRKFMPRKLWAYAHMRNNLRESYKKVMEALDNENLDMLEEAFIKIKDYASKEVIQSVRAILSNSTTEGRIAWSKAYNEAGKYLRENIDQTVRNVILTELHSDTVSAKWKKWVGESIDRVLTKFDGKPRNAAQHEGSGLNVSSRIAAEVADTVSPLNAILVKHGMAESFKNHPRYAAMVVEVLEEALDPRTIEDPGVRQAIVEIADLYRSLNDRWLYKMRAFGVALTPSKRFSLSIIHDPGLMGKVPAQTWVREVSDLIDWEAMKTRHGNINDRGLFLEDAYEAIMTERKKEVHDWMEDLASSNIAASQSKHRTLIFKPGAVVTYDRSYGSGSKNLSGRLINQLQKRAELYALIEELGPDLAKTKAEILSGLMLPGARKGSTRLGNLADPQGRIRFNAIFDHITGLLDIPVNKKFADTGKVIRMWADLVFGGTFGVAALTDISFMSHQLRFMGINLGRAEKALAAALKNSFDRKFRGRDPETRSLIQSSGAGVEALTNALARRLGVEQGGAFGQLGTLHNIMFNLNGVNTWTEIAQEAIMDVSQTHLARFVQGTLSKGEMAETSRYLSKFGIGEQEIDFMKRVISKKEDPSRITELDFSGDKELQNKLRAMNHETMRTGVLYPNISDEAYLRAGTHAGTPMGEGVRIVTKYLPFVFSVHSRIYNRLLHGYGKDGFLNRRNFLGNRSRIEAMIFVTQSLFMGWMVLNIKEMAKGREPLHFMDPDQINSENLKRIINRAGIDGVLSFITNGWDYGPTVGPSIKMAKALGDMDSGKIARASQNFIPGKTLPGVEPVIKSLYAMIFGETYDQFAKQDILFAEKRGQATITEPVINLFSK